MITLDLQDCTGKAKFHFLLPFFKENFRIFIPMATVGCLVRPLPSHQPLQGEHVEEAASHPEGRHNGAGLGHVPGKGELQATPEPQGHRGSSLQCCPCPGCKDLETQPQAVRGRGRVLCFIEPPGARDKQEPCLFQVDRVGAPQVELQPPKPASQWPQTRSRPLATRSWQWPHPHPSSRSCPNWNCRPRHPCTVGGPGKSPLPLPAPTAWPLLTPGTQSNFGV